jgi:hypothetical protein
MFGRQDSTAQDAAQIPDQSINNALGDDQPANDWQHPGVPIGQSDQTPSNSAVTSTTVQPSDDKPAPADDQADLSDQADRDEPVDHDQPDSTDDKPAVGANDLIDIKQQALSQLSPLVGHLDQSPEEKFRTTMMMIQASDDQSLVRSAFEAAQQIQDEKARAQALLDVINEINYFTQHQD